MDRIWSFDDHHIGKMDDQKRTLMSRVILRPKGLTNAEWYKHAEAVIKILNFLDRPAY